MYSAKYLCFYLYNFICSNVGDKLLVHFMIWKSNKEMRWHRDWSLERSMVTEVKVKYISGIICHCSVFSASLLKFDKKWLSSVVQELDCEKKWSSINSSCPEAWPVNWLDPFVHACKLDFSTAFQQAPATSIIYIQIKKSIQNQQLESGSAPHHWSRQVLYHWQAEDKVEHRWCLPSNTRLEP